MTIQLVRPGKKRSNEVTTQGQYVMTPSRLRTVFKLISLAMDMGKGKLVKQVVAYGVHFKITEAEVHQALGMSLTMIYKTVHSIKEEDKPKTVRIPDPTELGPALEKLSMEES